MTCAEVSVSDRPDRKKQNSAVSEVPKAEHRKIRKRTDNHDDPARRVFLSFAASIRKETIHKEETALKRICSVTLILTLLLACLVPALSEDQDPVVIRVGKMTYSRSLVQFSYESSLDVLQAFNGELSGEDRQSALDETIERIVNIGVMENKLKDLGQYDFTESEMNTLRYTAQQQYEKNWQELYSRAHESDGTVTEKEITQWLTEEGYTVDAFLREILINERQLRLFSIYCGDTVLNENDVNDYYLENYVEPDREKYENDIDRYDQEIALNGGEAFFVPEGYRYIKQVVLPLPEEAAEMMKPYTRRLNSQLREAQEIYLELADAAAAAETMEDFAEEKAAYQKARKDLEAERQIYLKKQREAIPMAQETIDLIREVSAAGIPFEESIKKYSIDTSGQYIDGPGFQFHPDSNGWPEEIRSAIAAMKKPGEISEPVVSEAGIHIFYYAGDVPAGAHVLTEEERAVLEESAFYAAQATRLNTLVQEWKQDYEIETHPEWILLE